MPKYRIKAEARTPRKTVGYRKSKGDFDTDPDEAQQVTLTPKDGRDWLNYSWFHFKRSWTTAAKDAVWKGHVLDQLRLVLEEVAPDGSAVVVDTTADWESMVVISGTATS